MNGLADTKAAGTLGVDYGTALVIDCPVCRRTIWAGTTCLHGKCPPPDGSAGGSIGDKPDDPPAEYLKTRGKKR